MDSIFNPEIRLNPIAAGMSANPKIAKATDPAIIKGAINPNPAAANANNGKAIENAIIVPMSTPANKLKANAAGIKAIATIPRASAPCITLPINLVYL